MKATEQIIAPATSHVFDDGTIFYDFGKEAFAVLEFEIRSDIKQDITIAIGEIAEDNHLDHKPGRFKIYYEEKIHLHNGFNRKSVGMSHGGYNQGTITGLSHITPFRYAEIHNLSAADIKVYQHAYFGYFNDDAADFHCNLSLLNQIWELCKYTMKATTPFGFFIDGNRERQAYEGDAYISMLSYLVCTSDFEIARNTIKRLFEFPTWPTEWQFSMIFIVYQYLMYGGNISDVYKWYPLLPQKLILNAVAENNLHSVAALDTRGRCPGFGQDITLCDIIDWPRGERDHYETSDYNLVTNCWFNGALQCLARLAVLLDFPEDFSRWRKIARANRRAIRKYMFRDGLFKDNPASAHTSIHSCIYPLLWNIAADKDKEVILKEMTSRGMSCSVFGAQFLLDCCYDNGFEDYALHLLTSEGIRSWSNMIRCGATITTEVWDDLFDPLQDWNHSWGTAPANIIVRHLAGIQPLEPGFRRFSVHPQPGFLQNFYLKTPTPFGKIILQMEKPGEYILEVPENCMARFRRKYFSTGTHHLH